MHRQLSNGTRVSTFLTGIVLALLGASASGGEPIDALGNTTKQQMIPAGSEVLVEKLKESLPDLPIMAVYETPLPDLFGVDLRGGQTLYGTKDGGFIISGDMYQLGDKMMNLAEERRAVGRKTVLDAVPRAEMVIFSPLGEAKTHVNVFTDVDCGYCRKLHQEMADINALGIEVRYLAYPRRGLDNPTYDKIVSAWCSDNPNQAITELKAGRNIASSTCANPVAKQYQIGQQIGVKGTPAIVTASGALLPGYLPAAELAVRIGLE